MLQPPIGALRVWRISVYRVRHPLMLLLRFPEEQEAEHETLESEQNTPGTEQETS
jgi:hypothetical protein